MGPQNSFLYDGSERKTGLRPFTWQNYHLLMSAASRLEWGLSVSFVLTQVLGRGWRGGNRLERLLSGSEPGWGVAEGEAAALGW